MNDKDPSTQVMVTTDKEDLIERLTELKDRFARGEVSCAALRVFNSDGTWEDVVLGGADDAERARVLENLQSAFRKTH